MRSHPLLVATILPAALLAVGTTGYMWVEGWSFGDAFFMTVITLSTVGYGETHPLSSAGRAFTALLILSGVFSFAAAATSALRGFVSGELVRSLRERRRERRMHQLSDHVVVCGYGRMGRLVCRELRERKLPFVVVDREEAKVSRELPDALVIEGDATQEECLRRAGIERAKTLLILMPKDADNLFVTMSARLLNERLFIVARAEDPATESKLKRAGANRVVAPYLLGGAHVVQSVLRPTLLEFIDLATQSQHLELQLEELSVQTDSALAGVTCGEALPREAELLLVALQRKGDKMRFRPREDERLSEGDVLVVLGSRDALDTLQRRTAPRGKVMA